ncbi:MAG: DUF58 domain-containing protein [Planctomycetes bacterium]|nr:DUF58 domain-containing protein [Planctomycetota bacterium]
MGPPDDADRPEDAASRRPPGAGPASALPPATADGERARRRASDRRARGVLVAVAAALVALSWLDSLPALFLGLVLLQAATIAASVRRGRVAGTRGVETGAPRVTTTASGRGWLSVAWGLVLVGIFLDSAPLRLAVCLGFAVSVASWPLVRANGARIVLRRRVPARARAGAPSEVAYEVATEDRRVARAVVVADNLGLLARPGAIEVAFDLVTATPTQATVPVTFERRGWKRLRSPRVSSRFPLGLFEVACDLAAPAEVLVHPREGRATPVLLTRLSGSDAPRAAAMRPQPGTEELYGLRAFRAGDDPRRIHWRTTARRGETTVVERRDEGFGEVVVALGRGVGRGGDADRRFERAVSVAATVVRAAVRHGVPARLLLGERAAPAGLVVRGRTGLLRALDALAEVRAVADRDGGERRPSAALGALRTPGTVVWVTAGGDEVAPTVADALVLRADDPDLARWVRGLP